MNGQKYSVLMSVYEKEKPAYLNQSIASMIAQTVRPSQIVIVKDGVLGPHLDRAIDAYIKANPDLFTVVSLAENVGLGRALDYGLGYCREELVARMDSDDISLPERCEKQLALFDSYPELAIVGSNIDEFYDDPSNIRLSRIVPSKPDEIRKAMGRRLPFNHPTVMFRKSEVLRCGGYGKMRRKQDLDLFSRMLHCGCEARNLNESLVLFRSDEGNYKRRKSWEYVKSYIEVMLAIRRRGQCGIGDLVYVVVGQMVLFILPLPLMKMLSDKLLRRKRQ